MKQAQGAIRQSPKGYADGGKVVSPWSFKGIYNTAKGALAKSPEQEEKDAALADYKARAQAERNPAPQPAPAQGISAYVSNTALQAREKAAGLKAGGAIRGKGTGTSDEVPIMASNGEFVIKAKAVKAIGLEVLEALNTIADKPDEKDSKAEAMREYGEGSESETHETAEDAIEGMKCGGKVKKMATGGYIAKEMATGVPHMAEAGLVDEAEKRAQLLSQIPTGGTGTGPTPVVSQPAPAGALPNRYRSSVDDAINAAAPPPKVGSDLGSKWGAIKAMGADVASLFDLKTGTTGNAMAAELQKQAPGVPIPTASAVSSDYQKISTPTPSAPTQSAAAATGSGALPQPYSPAKDSQAANMPVPGGDIPTAPVQATPMLNGQAGKDVGYGTTRFDVPGKSPLFTNMTDAAGMASNEKLVNRGAVTAQNQTAMDNLTARYKAEAVGMAQAQINAEQNARESMAADASNKGAMAVTEAISNRTADERARWYAELKLSSNIAKKEEKVAAQRTLDALNQKANAAAGNAASMDRTMVGDATTRRGQDITAAGQAVQAGALRRTQQIAQDKFGIELSQEARAAAKDALDAKQRDRLQAAFDAYDKEPSEKAAEKVRVLMGKEKAAPPDSWGIRQIVVDGQLVTQPGFVYNKQTGQQVQQGKPSVPDAATARTQAMAALKANPANKDEINKRLAAAGYQPI